MITDDVNSTTSSDVDMYNATICAIRSTLLICTEDHVFTAEVLAILERVFLNGGRHTFSRALKGWAKAIRSLLSRNYLDTTTIVHCKSAYNSMYAFRRSGVLEDEVAHLVREFDNVCGFPPIIIHPRLLAALSRKPSMDDFWRAAPLANIGRCAPPGDHVTNRESIAEFFRTTSYEWSWEFDLTNLSSRYGDLSRVPVPSRSRWSINNHASRDYSRSKGGKLMDFNNNVIHSFLYETIETIVPYRPTGQLIDILGNTMMNPVDWAEGMPIFECLYKHLGSNPIDSRLGLFGIIWSIIDLKRRDPDSVESSSDLLFCGYEIPTIRFHGEIDCSISAVEEQGYKSRVITVAPLSVAILQVTLRHLVDPSIRKDLQVKIGLLSKVKLYDLMVLISGSRRGVTDYDTVSFTSSNCESVDLTVATDSPYERAVETTVRPYVKAVLGNKLQCFSDFVLDVALSRRQFADAPEHWYHRCGIMMGEATSGVYLNVTSGILRAIIIDFHLAFQDYKGRTSYDADAFIISNEKRIQNWINKYEISNFGYRSSQSGDDVIIFNDFPTGEVSRFLILLYRIMGLKPSESTFYSSEYMGTFTEEFCINLPGSNGWVFIDIIKPRLFLPVSTEGIDSILSRIRQISAVLKYRRNDVTLVYLIADAVDNLISGCPQLRDRIKRYDLVRGTPAFLGGLDHPIQFEPGYFEGLPLSIRDLITTIWGCLDEDFITVKYSWAYDDITTETKQNAIRSGMLHIFDGYNDLEEGDLGASGKFLPLHTYKESDLVIRTDYPSYSSYSLELERQKSLLGMETLDGIIKGFVSSARFEMSLAGEFDEEVNPLIRLRNRRDFLISKFEHVYTDVTEYTPFMIYDIIQRHRMSFGETLVLKDPFLDVIGYNDQASLSLPHNLTIMGPSDA